MELIPLLVTLFCGGRPAFWIGDRRGARNGAFGFGLTFYASVLALGMTFLLLIVGA